MRSDPDGLWREVLAAGPEGAAEACAQRLVEDGRAKAAAVYAWDGRRWRLRAAAGEPEGGVPRTLVHAAPRAAERPAAGAREVRTASAWGAHVALRLWPAGGPRGAEAGEADGPAGDADLDRVLALLACAEACRRAASEANAEIDGLTGLLSALGGRRRLGLEVSRARRLRQPVALIHLAVRCPGAPPDRRERFEREAARIVRGLIRDTDAAAREGPEEFLVILPGSDASGAERVASRAASRIRELARERMPDAAVTVTAGIGDLPADAVDAAGLLAAAQRALYLAELSGGNCVRLAHAEVGPA